MKHKHAEMIKAKADNMELVVFEKQNTATHEKEEYKPIQPEGNRAIWFHEDADYFLCLPQHKEACLHWLNGEKSQVEYTQASYPYWCDIDSDESNWSEGHIFMDELLSIRIKPKKEMRWIGVYKNGATTDACLLRKEAENHPMITDFSANDWQFIEIEVEVTG